MEGCGERRIVRKRRYKIGSDDAKREGECKECRKECEIPNPRSCGAADRAHRIRQRFLDNCPTLSPYHFRHNSPRLLNRFLNSLFPRDLAEEQLLLKRNVFHHRLACGIPIPTNL